MPTLNENSPRQIKNLEGCDSAIMALPRILQDRETWAKELKKKRVAQKGLKRNTQISCGRRGCNVDFCLGADIAYGGYKDGSMWVEAVNPEDCLASKEREEAAAAAALKAEAAKEQAERSLKNRVIKMFNK